MKSTNHFRHSMNADIKDIYQQTVKISTSFASCCEHLANFYVANLALQASYPVVCRFLLEDAENSNDKAYVLEQLLNSLNGQNSIQANWLSYNKKKVQNFLRVYVPKLEHKMEDKHIENVAHRWEFGQNIDFKKIGQGRLKQELGITENEFALLNNQLTNVSTSDYYLDFFNVVIEEWCQRAQKVYTQTNQTLNTLTNQTATNLKVKL